MQLNLDSNSGKTSISAYSEQGIQIGGHWYKSSLLLTAEQVFENWRPHPITELRLNDLEPLFSSKPEVLILGAGQQIQFPPKSLYVELAAKGIGLEVMHTEAACRTFSILLSDDRAVVAALYLED